MDACRFTAGELLGVAQCWQGDSHEKAPVPLGEGLFTGGLTKDHPAVSLVLAVQREKPPQPRLSEWARIVSRHRDHFLRCAIGEQDPGMPTNTFPDTVWIFTLVDMGKKPIVQVTRGSLERKHLNFSGNAALNLRDLVPFYRVAQLEFQDSSEISFADDSFLVLLSDLVQVPGGFRAPCEPIDFSRACAGLPRRQRREAPAGDRQRRRRQTFDEVWRRLLDEYPWLTEEDLQRFMAVNAAAAREVAAPVEVPAPRQERLSEEDFAEAAFADVARQLQELRDRWSAPEGEDETNFYVHIPGGLWTATFRGSVANTVKYMSRAHTRYWKERFQWPGGKSFGIIAHTERGANLLARQWVRRSQHFFELSQEFPDLIEFDRVAHLPEEGDDFKEWVDTIGLGTESWHRVQELRNQWPVFAGDQA